jgi:hypothetical protein
MTFIIIIITIITTINVDVFDAYSLDMRDCGSGRIVQRVKCYSSERNISEAWH